MSVSYSVAAAYIASMFSAGALAGMLHDGEMIKLSPMVAICSRTVLYT